MEVSQHGGDPEIIHLEKIFNYKPAIWQIWAEIIAGLLPSFPPSPEVMSVWTRTINCELRMQLGMPGPDHMPENMSEWMPDRMSDSLSEYTSDRMPVGGDHSKKVIIFHHISA